jgi:integrase
MQDLIGQYIQSHSLSWSKSTIKSEQHRLQVIPLPLLIGDAEVLYNYLKDKGLKPYTVKTTLIRVSSFRGWLVEIGQMGAKDGSSISKFMRTHSNLFKNAYIEKLPEISFAEALIKIASVKDLEVRQKARQLLLTGMRWSESLTISGGMVLGKGSKSRRVTVGNESPANYTKSKSWFNRCLKEVGLTPHMLRKIHASKRVEMGSDPFALALQMGWANINTASKYVQSIQNDQLTTDLLKQVNTMEDNSGEQIQQTIL